MSRIEKDDERTGPRRRREFDVRDDEISVKHARRDVGVRAARERFGGLDVPATLIGMLAALALLVLLAGLIGAAIGVVGYQAGLDDDARDVSLASLAGGLVSLFAAFLAGGWAAGRMARYSGLVNGLMTGVWAVLLAALVSVLAALLGAEYDVLRRVELPQWFSTDALTVGAVVSGLVAVVTMLVAGAIGGVFGERYHRLADAAIVSTREGGLRNGRA